LDGDIWEVRVDGNRVIYRILFAQEGRLRQILLALDAFNKKTQKTPRATIDLAKRRSADWRRRGEKKARQSAATTLSPAMIAEKRYLLRYQR
jgi:phage-related protein